MSDIERKLRWLTASILETEPERVVQEAVFACDLGMDSMQSIELQMAYEEAFDIEIPDETAVQMDTFGAAVEQIQALVSSQSRTVTNWAPISSSRAQPYDDFEPSPGLRHGT